MAKKNETSTPTKQNPSPLTPEVRIASVIVLGCFLAVLVALTIKLFQWIIGS